LVPDYIEAHTNLGIVYQQLGRLADAEMHYQQALRYDNRPIEVLVNLGSLLLAQERWPEAGRVYARLLEFEPGRADARINLAHVLFALGRSEDAVAQLEEALRLDSSPSAHLAAGLTLRHWRQNAAARLQFETVLRLKPDDAAARAQLEALGGSESR
jgi:Tfp pilus assembly protein PilF